MFGQGIEGKERARLDAATDERIKRRVYFYLTNNGQDLPAPEGGLGQHVYRAELGNLYDRTTSSREARQRIQDLRKGDGDNEFESAVLDAGYRGFVNREQGTAVVLNADVPVAYEGTINWAQVRPRVNERIVPEIETRQEGGELVRKITNEQMRGVIKARPELARVAPSFTMQYGEARVAAGEAAAANIVLADSGLQFSEDAVTQSRLPFYSALDRAIEGGPKQAPVDQWLSFIKGLPGKGVKQDEIFWSGVEDWLKLQTGKVQRDDLRAFLASSGVRVSETVLRDGDTALPRGWYVDQNRFGAFIVYDEEGEPRGQGDTEQDAIANANDEDDPEVVKYKDYTLPGGTNYREILLTLPPRVDEKRFAEIDYEMSSPLTTDERYAELHAERSRLADAAQGQTFRSAHWDENNVIAHIRVKDRIIDGKKTLFVEEFQSDWAQEGKKKRDAIVDNLAELIGKEEANKAIPREAGFAKPSDNRITRDQVAIAHEAMAQVLRENDKLGFDTIQEARAEVYTEPRWRDFYDVSDEDAAIIQRWIDLRKEYSLQENEGGDLPPLAPFVTATDKWLGLAIKRVLIDAAKGDYAQVAFVNGEQSAERYSLEKHIDHLAYGKNANGTYHVVGASKTGRQFTLGESLAEKDLEANVGKEVAQKIVRGEGELYPRGSVSEGMKRLTGLDLKVGGEGMKAFYNSIVPASVNSTIKRFGAKLAPIKLARYTVEQSPNGRWNVLQEGAIYETKPTEAIARALADRQNGDVPTQQAFDVTPEMKAKIEEGLPLFSEDADFANAPGMRKDSWLGGRDELGRPTFGAGAKAYELAATIANNVLDKVKMKPISPELDRAMRKMKVEIEKMQMTAVDVANRMKEIPKDELEMVSDVIEGELKAGVTPPQRVYDLAASLIEIMRQQSAELVRLGMLSQEAANRWDGKYLPRFYETKLLDDMKAWKKAAAAIVRRPGVMQGVSGKSLKARGKFETIESSYLPDWEQQGWEVRDPNYKPGDPTVQIWRDYTKKEREDMGEVRDAMFRFIMGYTRTQRDIQLGRLFESLASQVAVSSPKEGYVEVPSSKIEGTFAPRYGKLAGKYVPTEVLDHLKSYDDAMHSEMLKMYRKGLSMWKEGKTVLNPVAHANNVISNLTMAHFAGVSYWDAHKYGGAVKDLIKDAPMVQEAKDAGLFLGTFSRGELVAAMPEQLRMLAGRVESRGAKTVETVWNAMSFWLRKPMGKAYEFEDQFFRYLIYKDARARGATPDDAVDYAQRYIFTYDNLPSGAKMVRDVALPFFAYTYKAVPAILRTAMEYPWRFAAPAGAFWAINTLMYAMAFSADDGDDDDALEVVKKYITDTQFREAVRQKEKEERKNLPPWMKGLSMTMFTPKAIRLGMDEVTNMPVFLDISRIFPGGDLLDANNNSGGVPLFQPITPGNPVLTTAMAMIGNKDLFFGKDIVDKDLDTDIEAAGKRAAWLWRQAAPAIAVGNYHWDRAMNVMANLTGQPIEFGPISYTGQDKSGNPVQWEYATMQTFGVKARPIDLELSEIIDKSNKKRIIRELSSEIKKINRLEGKGYYSETNAERMRENAKTKRDRIRGGMDINGDPVDEGEEE